MVVSPKPPRDEQDPLHSKTPTIISVVLHVVVFVLVIVGLPHWKHEIDIVDPVPIDLVADVGQITTTNKPPVDTPKPDKEEPPKKQDKPPKPEVKNDASPPDTTPEPPKPDELKDPPKPDEATEKIPDKKVEPKKEDKKPEPKKQDKKKPEPKKDPKENKDNFESLLHDLTPDEKKQPDTDETAKKATSTTPSPNVSHFSDVLSMSELDALRQQLGQCWSVMAGAQGADDLRVEIEVTVNMDRTVSTAKIVDQSRYGSDTFFRAAADSALRALRNPLCTPLHLPPEKYDQWHDMTIVFDPKEMF